MNIAELLEYVTDMRNVIHSDMDNIKGAVSHVDKVDSRNRSWQYNLNSVLSKHDFHNIGSGNYATIFASDKFPNHILKIFMKDAAYKRWYNFSKTNQDNPFVPQIEGNLIKITDIIYAMFMEKLNPYHSSSGDESKLNSAIINILRYTKRGGTLGPTGYKHIDDIVNEFNKNSELLDIHSENYMRRDDGQIVIIDPYYNWFQKHKGEYTIDPNEWDDD